MEIKMKNLFFTPDCIFTAGILLTPEMYRLVFCVG